MGPFPLTELCATDTRDSARQDGKASKPMDVFARSKTEDLVRPSEAEIIIINTVSTCRLRVSTEDSPSGSTTH